MSWQEVQSMYGQGFFVVDHSLTHPNMNHLNSSALYDQVVVSENMLSQNGILYPQYETDFCLPDGAGINNQSLLYYTWQTGGMSHVYAGYIYSPTGITNYNAMKTEWVELDNGSGQSLATFEYYVNQASSNLAVGILFHHINDHVCCGTQLFDNVSNFEQDLQYLSSNGFTVIIPGDLPSYNVVIAPIPTSFTTTANSSQTLVSSTTMTTITPSISSSTSTVSTSLTTITTTASPRPVITTGTTTTGDSTTTIAFVGTTSINHSQMSDSSRSSASPSTFQSTTRSLNQGSTLSSSSSTSQGSSLSSPVVGNSSASQSSSQKLGSTSSTSGPKPATSSQGRSFTTGQSTSGNNDSRGGGISPPSGVGESGLKFLEEAALGWSALIISIVPLVFAMRRREVKSRAKS